MLYTHALTVPAGTLASSPAEADLILTDGILTRVEVDFPFGCNHYVYAYVRQGLHQLWPLNPDGKARGSGVPIGSAEYHELEAGANILTVGGYSPDATYDHTLIFRLEVTPREIAERGEVNQSLLQRVLALLGVRS